MSGCSKDDGCDGACDDCPLLVCDECGVDYPLSWPRGLCSCGGNIVEPDTWRAASDPYEDVRLTKRDFI